MQHQVLLLAMFLSCILKKPDVDDDDLTEDDNNLKQDEEFLSRSERDIQGTTVKFRFSPYVLLLFVFKFSAIIQRIKNSFRAVLSDIIIRAFRRCHMGSDFLSYFIVVVWTHVENRVRYCQYCSLRFKC